LKFLGYGDVMRSGRMACLRRFTIDERDGRARRLSPD
jgi:hypothetical protein